MVNASLNWASIVGIVLAVGGALLYFMRSFKPALARDYDVFFAAVGLLCGGILFFQGWRLDPILQFGQFLLAGTTIFFAYESVRLRGVTTEQARRVSFFEDEDGPVGPRAGLGGSRQDWDDHRDRFDDSRPLRRRLTNRYDEDDRYNDRREPLDEERVRRPTRAIPERAASRRYSERDSDDWERSSSSRVGSPRSEGFSRRPDTRDRGLGDGSPELSSFGRRRELRSDMRRGSRPPGRDVSRIASEPPLDVEQVSDSTSSQSRVERRGSGEPSGGPTGSDSSSSSPAQPAAPAASASSYSLSGISGRGRGPGSRRDNSSRFDD